MNVKDMCKINYLYMDYKIKTWNKTTEREHNTYKILVW